MAQSFSVISCKHHCEHPRRCHLHAIATINAPPGARNEILAPSPSRPSECGPYAGTRPDATAHMHSFCACTVASLVFSVPRVWSSVLTPTLQFGVLCNCRDRFSLTFYTASGGIVSPLSPLSWTFADDARNVRRLMHSRRAARSTTMILMRTCFDLQMCVMRASLISKACRKI